jgi:antitoxin YefM
MVGLHSIGGSRFSNHRYRDRGAGTGIRRFLVPAVARRSAALLRTSAHMGSLAVDAAGTGAYGFSYDTRRPHVTTITATEARKSLYRLIDEVSGSHGPVLITGKRGNAVLVGADDWRAVQETLHLLSIPGVRESIIEGMETPVDSCKSGLEW